VGRPGGRWLLVLAWGWAGALGAGGLGAEPLTLDAAVTRALEANVTYQTALLAAAQADAARTGVVNWKGVAVSATQKKSSSDSSTVTTSSVGLALPLFDQLGATVAVDQDQATTVAVTAAPLSHSTSSTQLELAYRKALLAAEQARIVLVAGTKKAWLAQAVAQAQADAQVRETALKQTAYLDAKAQWEHGAVTLAEVRTALKDWADARTTQSTLAQTLTKAKAALAALVQSDAVTLAPVTVDDVKALVEASPPVVPAPEAANAVRTQSLEVANQQAKADALWWVDPQVSVTGTAVVPASGTTSWSGAVTVSLALGDVAVGDRLLADRAVALAQAALEAQRTAVRSSQAQTQLAIQAAAETVESRTVALTQAQELWKETEIQTRAGSSTALDLEEAQLGVTTAENDLLAAWVDAYGARLDAYW
jgi:outer membrane protein TolC